jgi:hypothetical protein
MFSDFLSLVLQAAGGGIADTANDAAPKRMGINLMIAGLLLQAISIAVFLAVCLDFAWRCRKNIRNLEPTYEKVQIRSRLLFKLFLGALTAATTFILIRSIFRVAELWGGFNGKLWNDEIDFMVLDGGMTGAATLLLGIFHPGNAFKGQWRAANWRFRTSKQAPEGGEEMLPSVGAPKEMKRSYEDAA